MLQIDMLMMMMTNEDDTEEDEDGDNEDEEDGDGDGDDDEDDDGGSGVQRIGKDGYKLGNYNDVDGDYGDMQKHPKKRKLKTLLSNYVFTPRAPAPSASSSFQKSVVHGGRDPSIDWTDTKTSILLNTWGDRYLKLGRKSLHSEEWQEVAEKVSQGSKIKRTDMQCQSCLDALKRRR